MVGRIIKIFSLFLIFHVIIACGLKMKLEDAQQVALKFHGTMNQAPPRALGNEINSFVSRSKDYIVIDDCPSITPDEIIKQGTKDRWALQERARDEYYTGNIEYAIIYADAAAKDAEALISKSETLFDKARYLAEAGDFIRAKNTLSVANAIYFEASSRSRNPRLFGKSEYLFAHGMAAVSFANRIAGQADGSVES
jgi:hypothetical protein